MKASRVLIVAVVITLVTLSLLIQRQFAQREQVSQAQVVLDHPRDVDEMQRFDLDGLEFERKLVQGAPFSATLTVEITQSDADGTNRTRTATSLIFRDAEGRTRRDRMTVQTSAGAPSADQQPQNGTINDPVAGFTYRLEHGARLYRRSAFRPWSASGSHEPAVVMAPSLNSAAPRSNSQSLPLPMTSDTRQTLKKSAIVASSEINNESLGEREVAGVKAEGTRISTSIPAGAQGNEQPMEIVIERWYSPALQTTVLIKRSDPRVGEIVYRLSEIKRGEPSSILFVLPSGYKISLDK
jgi:hypothetical protein